VPEIPAKALARCKLAHPLWTITGPAPDGHGFTAERGDQTLWFPSVPQMSEALDREDRNGRGIQRIKTPG
jgi:hypothetical protein